ncbi:DUF2344 domain-containing protein [Candidatus Sumerlaeota bacterium]|nr:DUF2344 domain-containing protein [Candidatus Sumerlaeota bacterium]
MIGVAPPRIDLSDDLLLSVQRPARYVGGEINTVARDHASVRASIALAFPDLYDIAMWYQGYQILYPLVNSHPDFLAERVCCPWPDMADAMRREGIPLHGLETRTPLREFSVIGFTLQHELNCSNVLEMLDLAGIPLLASERTDPLPIVIAGGPGALSPEPLAPFVDAFVIGEGEEVVIEILETCAQFSHPLSPRGSLPRAKAAPAAARGGRGVRGPDRGALLLSLARIPGVYVPRFYEPDAHGMPRRTRDDVPETIERRLFDITQETWSVRPVVPLTQVNFDRFALEIKRGCTRGCRFCQAGMITRPLRERPPEQIIDLAEQGLRSSGHREVSLMSLSSADYSALAPLMREINSRHRADHVSIALSSLRVNAFDVQFAEEISQGRRTGFTFAPEAGSERLRSVINKELSDEAFLNVVAHVFARGWQRLKFYFMCGLPTETDEDLQGIVDVTRRSVEIGRRFWGNRFEIAVSVSPFIPKPHTPFQWEPQLDRDEVNRRWHLVADALRGCRNVTVRPHSADQAWIEGVLARGDRRVGMAMLRAWRSGVRLDGWGEHFRLDLWRRALEEEGVDTDRIVHSPWDLEAPLPWDHIDAALGKNFLARERQKSLETRLTPDCAFDKCAGCDSCDFESIMNVVVTKRPQNTYESLGEAPPPPETLSKPEPTTDNPEPVVRMRVRMTKTGVAKYLSHLDYAKTIHRIIARARLPVAFSQGFHPRPRVMFTPPLPLGYTSHAEGADILLERDGDPEQWVAALRDASIPGIEFHLIGTGEVHGGNIQAEATHADYRITLDEPRESLGLSAEAVAERVEAFLALETCPVEDRSRPKRNRSKRNGKRGSAPRVKTRDFRALTTDLRIGESSDRRVTLEARLACGSEGSLDPLRLLGQILGQEVRLGDRVGIERTEIQTR